MTAGVGSAKLEEERLVVAHLDSVTIVHRGGVVLWTRALRRLEGKPIDSFIQKVFLEAKDQQEIAGSGDFHAGAHSLRWLLDEELGLVFVAVYSTQRRLSPMQLADLLDAVRDAFLAAFSPQQIRALQTSYHSFDEPFDELMAARFGGERRPPERKVRRLLSARLSLCLSQL